MGDLGKITKLLDAAVSEDLQSLKMKLLEERVSELEDVIEEICVELDRDYSEDTESEEEAKTEIIITGKTIPKKKLTTKSTTKASRTKKRKTD